MKKKISTAYKIGLISFGVFVFGVIMAFILASNKFHVLGITFLRVAFLALIISIICLIIVLIKRYKDRRRNEKDRFIFILGFWKWLNVISIIIYIIGFISSWVSGKTFEIIGSNLPTIANIILPIVYFVLTIIMVYGLFKKNLLGYYMSEIFIALSILTFIANAILDTASGLFMLLILIPTIFYISVAYILYKHRTYFGVKK